MRTLAPPRPQSPSVWAVPEVCRRAYVGAGDNERSTDVCVTVERRKHECSHPAAHSASDPTVRSRCYRRAAEPGVALGGEVGASGDENLDHVRVTLARRSHDCSRPAAHSASDPTARTRRIQRTALPVIVVLGGEVGAGDEQLDHVRVAIDRRMHERRDPIPSNAAAKNALPLNQLLPVRTCI